MSKRFLDFFPLPTFLAMPTVGLSLSDSTLRTVELRPHKGVYGVHSWSEYVLPSGIVTGGLITNVDQLTALLTTCAREKKIEWVRFALPEEKCFVYSTTISFPENVTIVVPTEPNTAGGAGIDIVVPRELVAATLTQNIPLSPNDVIFDFSVLGVDAKARTAQVVVYAFPRALAKAYADVFTAAGMTPLSFETESQSIARAVLEHGKAGTDLLIHFMTHKTIIAIVSDGRVVYASTIAHTHEDAPKSAAPADTTTVHESIELLTIRDELLKVVSYWHSMRGREKKDKIQSIVVSGNVGNMLDVPDYISKHTHIPSRFANVWQNAFSTDDHIPEIPFEKSLEFAATVGLALASIIPHHAEGRAPSRMAVSAQP